MEAKYLYGHLLNQTGSDGSFEVPSYGVNLETKGMSSTTKIIIVVVVLIIIAVVVYLIFKKKKKKEVQVAETNKESKD